MPGKKKTMYKSKSTRGLPAGRQEAVNHIRANMGVLGEGRKARPSRTATPYICTIMSKTHTVGALRT